MGINFVDYIRFSYLREHNCINVILLLWAIPFPPFIQIPQYGVSEDIIMFVVGTPYCITLTSRKW